MRRLRRNPERVKRHCYGIEGSDLFHRRSLDEIAGVTILGNGARRKPQQKEKDRRKQKQRTLP